MGFERKNKVGNVLQPVTEPTEPNNGFNRSAASEFLNAA